MTTETAAPAAEQNIDTIIGKYIDLRDTIEQKNKALAADLAPLQAAMKGIETYLMALANQTGQTKFGTARGTAFVTTKTGCNIADKETFWQHIQTTGSRHLL